MLSTHFDKEKLIITCRENGGNVNYDYHFFKEGFEEWAKSVDLDLADTEHLKRYLTEHGYNVISMYYLLVEIKEEM